MKGGRLGDYEVVAKLGGGGMGEVVGNIWSLTPR